jgi:hypothetical protein
MARYSAPGAFAVLLAIPLIITAVLGIGVVIQPDTIREGSPISISLSNVTDGYILNVTLSAAFTPAPGTSWLNLTNWNYPFALTAGHVTVAARNVNQLTLLVRAGGTVRTSRETGAGNISTGIPMDFLPLMYHDFRIGYEVHDAGAPLMFTLVQEGTKAGPVDAVITPSIIGAGEGNLTVTILTNGTLQASREIRILNTAPSPTPEAGNTTVAPSPTASPTTLPATPTPPPVNSPPPSPPVTPSTVPAPSPGGPSPWIIGFIAVVIIITLIADYFLLKD